LLFVKTTPVNLENPKLGFKLIIKLQAFQYKMSEKNYLKHEKILKLFCKPYVNVISKIKLV